MAASAQSLSSMQDAVPHGGAVERQGAFMWLVKPGAFVEAPVFEACMQAWTRHYQEAGGGRSRLPGARGALREAEGFDEGLELPLSIEAELSSLGLRLGIPFPAAPNSGSS